MDIVKIAAVGLVAGLLAIIIKKNNPELSVQISIAAGIMIFLMVADQLVYAVDFLRNFSEQYEGVYEGVVVTLPLLGNFLDIILSLM